VAGAAEANIRETLIACEKYAEYGARAVAVISPVFHRLGQESIYAYFKELAEQSVIDVTVYNIPMLSTAMN
jgi:4-hydroxy-tetrahydrodipicolinate synthase